MALGVAGAQITMDVFEKVRKFENLHIVFWLLKDTCWMLELKLMGALMIIPTLALCVYIIYKTRQTREVFINTAILFWICANSFWMLMEFFVKAEYKFYATIPFALGFIFVAWFYIGPSGEAKRELK
jgi:hypothetical protein